MKKKPLNPQIQQLIASNEATNNYLALTLLQSQLHYTFEEAFACLQLEAVKDASIYGLSKYQLIILDYTTFYSVEHKWTDQLAYPFLEIRRYTQQGNKRLKNYDLYLSIDYFESENERDMYEALVALPNLGQGLRSLFTTENKNE